MLRFLVILFLVFNFAFAGGQSVLKHKLSNHATVLFKETQGKGIIAGVIFVKGGSIEDPQGKKGLTNLLFRMLLKKTKKYSGLQINKIFEDSGGFITTTTGDEFSTIEFALRTEDFKKGMDVIKSILFEPVFEKEKLKQEVENIIAQIKAKKEEGFSYAFEKLRENIYKGTPYEVSPLGIPEDLKKITVEDLKKRLKEIQIGKRFVISIVGDLSYKEAEPVIKDTFSKLANIPYTFPRYSAEIKGETVKTYTRDGAQSTILVAYNAPRVTDKEFFAMKVLNAILGSGFTSRLFQELREKRGLAYAVGSFYPTRINIGNLIAYIGTAPEKTEESLKGIIEVVKSIKNGVSDEEIKTAKEKIIGHYLLDSQTRAKQAYYIGFFETVGLGYQMFKQYVDKIQKVTKKQILNAYNKYIPLGYTAVVVKP